MGIVIVKTGVSKKDFEEAKEDYGIYIKITADIEMGSVALGGEYHADAEKILLKGGSKQENIWGGGINLETKTFETNAIVNLRSGKNDSTEILNNDVKKRFLSLAGKVFKNYV